MPWSVCILTKSPEPYLINAQVTPVILRAEGADSRDDRSSDCRSALPKVSDSGLKAAPITIAFLKKALLVFVFDIVI